MRRLAKIMGELGVACLIVVVLTHVCEARHLFPWMGWGLKRSAGHYLDLCSAGLAATAFAIAALAMRTVLAHGQEHELG